MQRVRWRMDGQIMTGVIVGTYRENGKTYLIVSASDGKIYDLESGLIGE